MEGGDVQFCMPPYGSFLNTSYYKDNWGGSHIEFDGMTSGLFARAVVQPCETYHIKLVIADVSDNLLDSGVFLEKKSFRSIGLKVNIVTPNNDGVLLEGCGTAKIIFSLLRPSPIDLHLGITINGLASEEDFSHNLPDTLLIPAGEEQAIFSIKAISDLIDEGPETINIFYDVPNCSIQDSVSLSIVETGIFEVLPDSATIEPGIFSDIPLTATIKGNIAPGNFTWFPTTGLSDPTIANPVATIDDSITYTVTFTSDQCVASKNVFIVRRDPFGIYIPNAFSPNGDNLNDHFSIFFTEQTPLTYDLAIFDRWGTRLYLESGNNQAVSVGWDGTYKNCKSLPGVYLYTIKLSFPDQTDQILSGDITLIR